MGWRLIQLGIMALAAMTCADLKGSCAALDPPITPSEAHCPVPAPTDRDAPSAQRSGQILDCVCTPDSSSLRSELRQHGFSLLRSPECSAQEGLLPAWRSGQVHTSLPPISPRLHVLLCTWLN
jgi:hypothetical protein